VSRRVAEKVYGVILTGDGKAVDQNATDRCRGEIRDERRRASQPLPEASDGGTAPSANGWQRLLKFSAALEVATDGKRKMVRCTRCGHLFCEAENNYKRHALHRVTHLNELMPPLPSGEPYIGEYHIYACPGCATQLQVDMFSPSLGGDAVLWDTRIDVHALKSAKRS
jgi:uncharacterized C2H2 Zn-finger protein